MSERERLRDGSALVTAAERTGRRLRTAAATARVARLVPRTAGSRSDEDDGTDTDGERRFTDAIRRIAGRSAVATALRRTRTRIGTAAANARLAGAGQTIGRYVRGSYCYRWLTAEPDPDVIVIDLRETATVGPALRAVQRGLEALGPSVASARLTKATRVAASRLRERPIRVAAFGLFCAALGGLAALAAGGDPGPPSVAGLVALGVLAAIGTRSRASWNDVRESRLLRALAAVFEPPEPPATRTDADDAASRPSQSPDGRDADSNSTPD